MRLSIESNRIGSLFAIHPQTPENAFTRERTILGWPRTGFISSRPWRPSVGVSVPQWSGVEAARRVDSGD